MSNCAPPPPWISEYHVATALRFRLSDDGSSSFAFTLPVRPEWAGRLASATLSGPGGSFTLGGEGERAAAIFLDPRSGRGARHPGWRSGGR